MSASLLQVILLAVVQGLAELLPVSSSAHVIIAEKLMGLDPSAPAMTFLLVMLHTGTMFAVILYFFPKWQAIWRAPNGADGEGRVAFLRHIIVATAVTGVIGLGLKAGIEHTILKDAPKAEIEELFKNLPLIAASLFAAALVIIGGGLLASRGGPTVPMSNRAAAIIGAVQGLCLPFRGFSRSGATISVGLLQKLPRDLAETFSFALAVVLTPPVIFLELHRLIKAAAAAGTDPFAMSLFVPGLTGMVFSFIAGLGALRWLSSWLEHGRWHFFGFYCLAAAAGVLAVNYSMG